MNENRYLISDTSKQLGVEPHVLRYWEEELDMPIKRNEMGHRYYTEDDIRVLKNVRDMKNQGFQLKAIKHILHEIYTNAEFNVTGVLEHKELMDQSMGADQTDADISKNMSVQEGVLSTPAAANTPASMMSAELKMEQFQEIMLQIIAKALEMNQATLSGSISDEVSAKVSVDVSEIVSEKVSASVSERVSENISESVSEKLSERVSDRVSDKVSGQVSDRVLKQMDYILRENEEREEERFRKLDEAIRQRQKANAEAAAALAEESKSKKKHRFGRKEKAKKTKSRIFG